MQGHLYNNPNDGSVLEVVLLQGSHRGFGFAQSASRHSVQISVNCYYSFFFLLIISIVTIDGSHICFVGRLRFFLIVKGDITLSRPRLNIVSEFS